MKNMREMLGTPLFTLALVSFTLITFAKLNVIPVKDIKYIYNHNSVDLNLSDIKNFSNSDLLLMVQEKSSQEINKTKDDTTLIKTLIQDDTFTFFYKINILQPKSFNHSKLVKKIKKDLIKRQCSIKFMDNLFYDRNITFKYIYTGSFIDEIQVNIDKQKCSDFKENNFWYKTVMFFIKLFG